VILFVGAGLAPARIVRNHVRQLNEEQFALTRSTGKDKPWPYNLIQR